MYDVFVDYLGDTPRARLLDFLGDHPTSDYNITELATKGGMTRQTAYAVLGDIVPLGMVKHTRDVGQSKMFQLNTDHPVVQSVLQADMLSAREGKKAVLVH